MKTRNIFQLLLGVSMTCALTACIDDNSTYGGDLIPGLSVTTTATDPDKLPEVNFNFGDECVITPQVNYTGSAPLSYEWSVGTYNNGIKGELEVVSHEPVLRHYFPSGGSYYAHLDVTDGTVGIVQEYQVNINRTFEQGYIIVSNDREGYGNLTFIKDLTAEDKEQGISSIVMEHSVENMNEGVRKENLVGVTILRASWPQPGYTRVVASYGSMSYFLDPNTFMTISTIDHDKVIPGFKGSILIGGTNAMVYDSSKQRYITLIGADMIGVERTDAYKGVAFDALFFDTYYSYGTQSFDNYFVRRSPFSIFFVSAYAGGVVDDTSMPPIDGKPVFEGHSLINAFKGITDFYEVDYGWGPMQMDYSPCVVLTKEESTGKYYLTRLMGFGPYDMEMAFKGRAEIQVTANTAIPDVEGPLAFASAYDRFYYTSGNSVYVMTMKSKDEANWPDKNQAALTYPANEEITYMTVNADTNELIVATADKSTGRGNVYFYNVADVRTDAPNAATTAKYTNCADRISYIVYKPRVAN